MRNRLNRRLRRLREPRYLLGGIVGVLYFYFAVVARMVGSRIDPGRRRGSPPPEVVLPALFTLGPALSGVALLGVAAVCWILPLDASLLAFSDAEVQFLLPAPISRRQLLVHRLMRSQLGLLFAALIPAILFPSASMWMRMRTAAAMWVLLVAGKIYFNGVAAARAHLRSASVQARRAALAPAVLVLAATCVVGGALMRAFAVRGVGGQDEALTRIVEATTNGAARVVLSPFVALARPLFAESFWLFAASLPYAVAVLAVAVAWVLRSDEAFQTDVTQVVARQNETRAQAGPVLRLRATGWLLPLSGKTETLFFWKNGMLTLRSTSSVMLLRYAVPLAWLTVLAITFSMSASQARELASALCMFSLFVAAFVILFVPQTMRSDLRSDLRHLELLKTWPVKAAAVIRGEMLWPAAVVTGFAWFALLSAASFSAAAFPQWNATGRVSATVAAMLLAPALIVAQYAVHTAAAVLFPAWVSVGGQRARGLDAMGQRMIMFGGIVLTLIVVVGPGAIAGGLLWFIFYRLIGPVILVPAAAICLAIVGVEVLLIAEALGQAYERVDLTAVERAE
jgi:hypothetical protein